MTNKRKGQATIVEHLVAEIRAMIENGTYKTNDKLPTEQEFAEQFNVSRSSVREALKTLNYLGILESHVSRGTYVGNMNNLANEVMKWSIILGNEGMHEVFVLGTAIDTQVALTLIKQMETSMVEMAPFIAQMNKIISDMNEATVANDFDAFESAFIAYFRVMYVKAGNSVFISINECINSLIVHKVCKSYYENGYMLAVTVQLASIWNAICRKSIPQSIEFIQTYGTFSYDESFAISYPPAAK